MQGHDFKVNFQKSGGCGGGPVLRNPVRRPFPPRAGEERKLKPYGDFLCCRAYWPCRVPSPGGGLTLRQGGSMSLERAEWFKDLPHKKNPGLEPGFLQVFLKELPVCDDCPEGRHAGIMPAACCHPADHPGPYAVQAGPDSGSRRTPGRYRLRDGGRLGPASCPK